MANLGHADPPHGVAQGGPLRRLYALALRILAPIARRLV